MSTDERADATSAAPDVVVIGAGIAGISGIIRLRSAGFSVVGLEAAPDVGGVWYHNNYPGARVDLESETFCYLFDEGLYRDWEWSERYAAQPEVLAYLRHVADRFDVRRNIRFGSRVSSTIWMPDVQRWRIETSDGEVIRPRFVLSAAGQLSEPRLPPFEGLADFRGDWYLTSRWPHVPVNLGGKRVAVVGTGSSGVQAITEIAKTAAHLTVMQRTPHYAVPAHNRAPDRTRIRRLKSRFPELWPELLQTASGGFMPPSAGKASTFTAEEQQQLLQQRWDFGSQAMLWAFSDQGTNWDTNALVSQFVRDKVRDRVEDPALRASLVPDQYPIGTKRLILDTGYYEVFAQPNVDLVDLRNDPFVRITAEAIETRHRRVEIDVIVFALGFEAFTGALSELGIGGAEGPSPVDLWSRGPETLLGLQTRGFPNLFMITGPGSPSVDANMFVGNAYHIDWVTRLLEFMRRNGHTRVEPSLAAQARWGRIKDQAAESLIRRQIDNYKVKVNPDGTRIYWTFVGGLNTYVEHCEAEARTGYPGFEFAH